MIIHGNYVGTVLPKPDWNQEDPTKADYIKGKETVEQKIADAQTAAETAQTAAETAQTAADNRVLKTGDTMTGNLSVPAPAAGAHAVNKTYVDTRRVAATLTAAGWSSAAPYTQSVTIAGLSDAVYAKAYPDIPDNDAEEAALAEETAKVTSCRRSGATMTFRCREDKPALDISVIVEVYV